MSSVARAAYSRHSEEYTSLFGSIDSTHAADQELVLDWARGLDGKIIDAGCGPGQWTNYLHTHGMDVEGLDQVPEFITTAGRRYPDAPYRIGRLEDLGVTDGSLAGILAWYSIIHTPPSEIGSVLREFARCLKPGGSLVLGFFEGKAVERFPHAVTTAYVWPAKKMSEQLQGAGFMVEETHSRAASGTRPHAAMIAREEG